MCPVREAIEAGDAAGLSAILRRDPAAAATEIRWGPGGKNRVPPLHFVCDAVFRKQIDGDTGVASAEVLLEAGEDPNRAYARSGDTFLIAAASLGAEAVGLLLLERRAEVGARGLFGATALHWAAIMGCADLAEALASRGCGLETRDEEYRCTPLEWALHGWTAGTNGHRDGLPAVARALVRRGAVVPANAAEGLAGPEHAVMRDALES